MSFAFLDWVEGVASFERRDANHFHWVNLRWCDLWTAHLAMAITCSR